MQLERMPAVQCLKRQHSEQRPAESVRYMAHEQLPEHKSCENDYRGFGAAGGAAFWVASRIALMLAASFSPSAQTYSTMSLFGSSISVTFTVTGLVSITGSMTVMSISMWPKSRRWNRSWMCIASLCG